MATISWPSVQAAVEASGAVVREPGMIGYHQAYGLPEYPTGTATYFQDAWANTDGWNAANASIAVSGGRLVVTGSGTEPRTNRGFSFSGSVNHTMRLKLRALAGSGTFTIQGTSNSVFSVWISNVSAPIGQDVIIDLSGNAAWMAGTVTWIEIVYVGPSTNQFSVDWIYIGDGSYAANSLIDISGNGNHFTIFGGTPDGLGNIIRDGVNDYERSASVLATVPDVWAFHIEMPQGNAQLASIQTLVNYKAQSNTVGFFWIYRDVSADTLQVQYQNGSTYVALGIASVFTGYSASRLVLDIVVNWITGAVRVYRNGALFGTATMTTPVKPTSGDYLYFGAYQSINYFAAGTFGKHLVFDLLPDRDQITRNYLRTTLYESVPEVPLIDGFSEVPQDGTLRSSVDSGPPKVRQRFTALTTAYDLAYGCTAIQKQILDDFYRRVARGGSLAFNWPHPHGYTCEARFSGPPQYVPDGSGVIARCRIEVLP